MSDGEDRTENPSDEPGGGLVDRAAEKARERGLVDESMVDRARENGLLDKADGMVGAMKNRFGGE